MRERSCIKGERPFSSKMMIFYKLYDFSMRFSFNMYSFSLYIPLFQYVNTYPTTFNLSEIFVS